MKKFSSTCFVTFCLLFLSFQTNAQWESNGPYGGAILSVKAKGSDLFAGTYNNGVFRSSDNGQHWTAANNGIKRKAARALAANSAGIFAGTDYDGVFFSTDNGNTWIPRNTGLGDLHINSLFAANNGDIYAGTSDGVYSTTNNGLTWSLANNGIPSTYVIYSWAQMGDTIYGGSYGYGLFMTDDDGANWTQVSNGFPLGGPPLYGSLFVYGMLANGNTIYAGTSTGIYKSTNRGINWSSSNTGMPSGMWATAFAVTPGHVIAGTHTEGFFVSTDGGNSWTASNTGYHNWPGTSLPHGYARVNEMAVIGTDVLAATFNGMYRSTNSGASWMDSNEGILATDITAFATSSNAIFAGTNWTGVYVSTDQGGTWSRANTGLATPHVLAMTTKDNWTFASVLNKKTYRTNNNGATWTPAYSGLPNDPVLLDHDATHVYAVSMGSQYESQKLYESLDDGLNWNVIDGSNAISGGMTAMDINDPYIYIGTGNGMVLRSSDHGLSWQDITSYMPVVKVTAILALDDVTYIGTDSKGIYKVNNSNLSMNFSGLGMTNNNITGIVLQNGVLFASTWGGGVFASMNDGQIWFPVNDGLDNRFVQVLAGESAKVYAGTDAGVYQTTEETFSKIAILAGLAENNDNQNISVYPNPCNTQLCVSAGSEQKMNITIQDVSGKMIYHSESNSGLETIDLKNESRGVYFITIKTGTSITTKRIVLY
jgi:photosystem II stability/assembly factor-like uncharacterized protein